MSLKTKVSGWWLALKFLFYSKYKIAILANQTLEDNQALVGVIKNLQLKYDSDVSQWLVLCKSLVMQSGNELVLPKPFVDAAAEPNLLLTVEQIEGEEGGYKLSLKEEELDENGAE